jgi:hypothetical protein
VIDFHSTTESPRVRLPKTLIFEKKTVIALGFDDVKA